jgi:hypothetical protein
MSSDRTRRQFLKTLALVGACGAISRCAERGPSSEEIAEMARAYDPALRCDDTTGLWPAEIATRQDNEYVDVSGEVDEHCFLCDNFLEPAVAGACGTCRTVKGPIHPLGWCLSWTARS